MNENITSKNTMQSFQYENGSGQVLYYWIRMIIISAFVGTLVGFGLQQLIYKGPKLSVLWWCLFLSVVVATFVTRRCGFCQVEVSDQGITMKSGKNTTQTYLFKDYYLTPRRNIELILGAIPVYTKRYIILNTNNGSAKELKCCNFSEATFARMFDKITDFQRELLIEENGLFVQREEDELEADDLEEEEIEEEMRVLPMPGEEGFVSAVFSINKKQMVSVEQKRYRNIMIGLLCCSLAMYVAWYYLVYQTTPVPNANAIKMSNESLIFLAGGVILILFVVIPAFVMLPRFIQEKKRIPLSIIVENEQFTIDGSVFKRRQVEKFMITSPGGEKIGNTSHRRHISFVDNGKSYSYNIGSGTVKNAEFPDYNLLYMMLEAQRRFINKPSDIAPSWWSQTRTEMISPYTEVTLNKDRVDMDFRDNDL